MEVYAISWQTSCSLTEDRESTGRIPKHDQCPSKGHRLAASLLFTDPICFPAMGLYVASAIREEIELGAWGWNPTSATRLGSVNPTQIYAQSLEELSSFQHVFVRELWVRI